MPGRIRTIKPEFFLSENLGELSPLHRLLFAGLWCYADREGRLEDRPKYLKNLILPWDKANVDRMLADLARHPSRFIVRYEANGNRFIQIVHFTEHQRPNSREANSEIPACTDYTSTLSFTRMHAQEQEEGKGMENGNGREGKVASTPKDATPCAECSQVIEALNRKTGRAFESAKGSGLHDRHSEHGLAACLRVVEVVGSRLIANSKTAVFARPKTLFGPENFLDYKAEATATKVNDKPTHGDVIESMIREGLLTPKGIQ